MQSPLPDSIEDALAEVLCRNPSAREAGFEALVRAHPEHAAALERRREQLAEPHDTLPQSGHDASEPELTTVGPYKILGVLGEGGMGSVFLAEQKDPVRRRVALKLVKRGMDSKAVLQRFDVERQALAVMNHDNIARVFEAGTAETGQPYFVMEHVPGLPIQEYCDRHRVSLDQRLELFQRVCDGVQHAHQKGIIHRDLKPKNVLVTDVQGRPTPKIIDFGIARATDHMVLAQTIFTEHGQILGTPEYMSPEQADPTVLDIDTRTDIYSLGVMLYELLVGELPFSDDEVRHAGFLAMQKVIREVDPPRPSTRLSSLGESSSRAANARSTTVAALRRMLRTDLDWVVLKAMDKDRNRRYESAAGLGADVARFLAREPVVAGPPGAGYRLRKLVLRYRTTLAISALLLLGLVGSLATGLWVETSSKAQIASALESERKAHDAARTAHNRAVERERQALWSGYVASIRAAQAAVQTGETADAIRYLETCAEELRGFEWFHLKARCDESEAVLEGHAKAVLSVAIDEAKQRVVSTADDGTIRVWDLRTGRCLSTAMPAGPEVMCLAATPDGGTGVFYDMHQENQGRLRFWNREDGWIGSAQEGIAPFFLGKGEISADGSEVVVHGNHMLFVGDTREPEKSRVTPDLIGTVAVADDFETIAIGETTGRFTLHPRRGKTQILRSAGLPVKCIALTNDGSFVACASGFEIEVWSASSKQWRAICEEPTLDVTAMKFTRDGKRIVAAGRDGSLRVWEVATSRCLAVLPGHVDGITDLEISADGEVVVSGSMDGTVRIWRLDGIRPSYRLPLPGVWDVSFLSNHAFVSVQENNRVVAWDGVRGKQLGVFAGKKAGLVSRFFEETACLGVSSSRDGRHVLTRVSPNGAFSEPEDRIDVYDSSRRCWVAHIPLKTPAHGVSMAMLEDGRLIVGSASGDVELWNYETATRVATLSAGVDLGVLALASSGHGRFVCTTDRGKALVWDDVGGQARDLKGIENASTLVMSSDGDWFATGSFAGGIEVFDATTGERLARMLGHRADVSSLQVTSDDRRLVSGSRDGTVRIWEVEDHFECVAVLRCDGLEVLSVSLAQDDGRLVAAARGSDDNSALFVWSGPRR